MLKIGDKVRIRKDLKSNHPYGIDMAVKDMLKYKGKQATIENICCNGNKFYLDIDKQNWTWTVEMFEQII
jgi:hypothetical protein